MPLSDDLIQKTKDALEKDGGKEVSWEEAELAANQLGDLAGILFDLWLKEKGREDKLKESPKGYVLEGVGYTCHICYGSTREVGNWYDKWGIKCTTCQAAVDKKVIPASLAKNRDSFYSVHDLESNFKLTKPVLREWIKKGIIKVRDIPAENGRVHTQLFLIKDNKDFLPPKKLVESHMVREERDGQTWHRSYPWYSFADPFEHLKGYKIMEYMRVIPPEEMKAREEAEKKELEKRQVRREMLKSRRTRAKRKRK